VLNGQRKSQEQQLLLRWLAIIITSRFSNKLFSRET